MNPQQKRIKIAELSGYKPCQPYLPISDELVAWNYHGSYIYKVSDLPNYIYDRDAMHSAISAWEMRDFTALKTLYNQLVIVIKLFEGQEWETIGATAEQLADAFLLGHNINPYSE